MHLHDRAFYVATFFILGVFVASFSVPFSLITISTAFLAVLIFFIAYSYDISLLFWYGGFILCVIVGAGYFVIWNDYHASRVLIPFNQSVLLEGMVARDPDRGETQQLTVRLHEPFSGTILVRMPRYPAFHYGDVLRIDGVVRIPTPSSYAHHLLKDGISGVVSLPSIELLATDRGSPILSFLFSLKERIVAVFQTTLPPQEAAFLSGITLGERAEFSKEFKEAMSRSGTTHLVALSGYNISILVLVMFSLLRYFFSPPATFWTTLLIIIGFVLMTGAEASVVRAAIMGSLILLAERVGRARSMRNIIALAALTMILANPNVLRFDIGFQLSFFALLGIVYLMPALRSFFMRDDKPDFGFLNWRENLLTTSSAQLAVIPLLLFYFQTFSLLSLVANILILELIPFLMLFGFMSGFSGLFFSPFSHLLALFIHIPLSYILGVISFFSTFYIPLPPFPLFGSFIYYTILILFIVYQYKRTVMRSPF